MLGDSGRTVHAHGRTAWPREDERLAACLGLGVYMRMSDNGCVYSILGVIQVHGLRVVGAPISFRA